jgi:hypothetical protein
LFSNNPDDPWARGRVEIDGEGQLLARDLYHENAQPAEMNYICVQEPFVADSTNATVRFTHIDSPHPLSRSIVLDSVSIVEGGNLIRNGSFELPLPGGNTTTELPWWTVHNNVDVVGAYWEAIDGSHSLDLSGDNAGPGTSIEQTIPAVPGRTYVLSFWYANNADTLSATAELTVTGTQTLLGRQISHSGSQRAAMNYTLFEDIFVADTNRVTLKLTHLDSPDPLGRGIVIDNIAITPAPTFNITFENGEGVQLDWNANAQRQYQVEFTSNLNIPNWLPVTEWIAGSNQWMVVTQTNGVFHGFYRLSTHR